NKCSTPKRHGCGRSKVRRGVVFLSASRSSPRCGRPSATCKILRTTRAVEAFGLALKTRAKEIVVLVGKFRDRSLARGVAPGGGPDVRLSSAFSRPRSLSGPDIVAWPNTYDYPVA